jgi:hypothetical protein
MQLKKQFFKETIGQSERFILSLIFLFAIINWLLLTLAEKLAPPDFYRLVGLGEKLFSGDLNIGVVPPLFPLLLFPLGKLIGIFVEPTEAFIIAGRMISLAAGLGVLYLSYRFLKKIVGKFAVLGILFFVISPWFLKLLAFPITDMLYLFFVSAAFYTFLNKSPHRWPILSVVGGVLTRFEGVLLIFSGFLNFFKFKKRYLYILLVFFPLLAGVLLFFGVFTPRFFAHFKDIILPQKSYLFVFQHPLEFLNVFYGNILFFIPYSYPYALKMFLLLVVLAFFIYGIFRLFKIERNLTIALVAYEVLFLVAKGYINAEDPEREFRRIFSGLWIFYLIGFIGCYFFLKKIKQHKRLKNTVLFSGGVLLTVLAVSQEAIKVPLVFPALLMILPLLYPLKNLSIGKIPKYLSVFILLAFAVQVYHTSYLKSENYVASYAHKAAYAAAQWLNLARLKEKATVLSYTNNIMVDYYLENKHISPKKFQLVHFTVPMRNTPGNRDLFIKMFFEKLKDINVDYIIFDNYVVRKPEFTGVNDVQRMLYEERENPQYFRMKKLLFYKGKNVGYVLKPIHVQTNH